MDSNDSSSPVWTEGELAVWWRRLLGECPLLEAAPRGGLCFLASAINPAQQDTADSKVHGWAHAMDQITAHITSRDGGQHGTMQNKKTWATY